MAARRIQVRISYRASGFVLYWFGWTLWRRLRPGRGGRPPAGSLARRYLVLRKSCCVGRRRGGRQFGFTLRAIGANGKGDEQTVSGRTRLHPNHGLHGVISGFARCHGSPQISVSLFSYWLSKGGGGMASSRGFGHCSRRRPMSSGVCVPERLINWTHTRPRVR